mmetsp:Transcript_1068/g.2017  ORF Transcript_1068/g.2017 Transcript_1068/m.2017 type:complete len:243 (-) Transcript_1068:124-852(-)
MGALCCGRGSSGMNPETETETQPEWGTENLMIRKDLKGKSREEMADLLFDAFDDDDSGNLTMWEFCDQYRRVSGSEHSHVWEALFHSYDKDKNGLISREEFVDFVVEVNRAYDDEAYIVRMSDAIQAFRRLDASPTDVRGIAKELKHCEGRYEMAEKLWDAMDVDGEGTVDYPQFHAHISQVVKVDTKVLFKGYDVDGTGLVTKMNFIYRFLSRNQNMSDDKFKEQMKIFIFKFRNTSYTSS